MAELPTLTDPILDADAAETSVIDLRAEPQSSQRLPGFAIAMRGYDRGQVDDFVERQIDFVRDAEQRAVTAEGRVVALQRRIDDLEEQSAGTGAPAAGGDAQRLPSQKEPPAYDGLGERVSEILSLAEAEANHLREQGKAHARQLVEDAREQVQEEIAAAEGELARLVRARDSVVKQLRELGSTIATTITDTVQPQRTTRQR